MTVLSSENGHSRSQEKNVARRLYISIVAAVVLGMILFFWVGQRRDLDPNETRPSSQSTQSAPESSPNAPASR